MINDFDNAFEQVIGLEGGYSNDPNDAGGETNFGICKRDHPNENIAQMTKERAKEIYRAEYWNGVKGDLLPYPICILAFDCAVNQGVGTAIKLLQTACRVEPDGKIGNLTIKAAERKEVSEIYLALRAKRYISTKGYDIYGHGWFIRLFKIAMRNPYL